MAKSLKEPTQNLAPDPNLQTKNDSYDYTHAKPYANDCDII